MSSNPILAYRKRKAAAAAVRPVPVCRECGSTFIAKRADAAFCGPKCRMKAMRQERRTGASVTDNFAPGTTLPETSFEHVSGSNDFNGLTPNNVTDNSSSTITEKAPEGFLLRKVDKVTYRLLRPGLEAEVKPEHVAWLIDVAHGSWYVRFRDVAVGPLTLRGAQAAAQALVQGRFEGTATQVDDPLVWLNLAAARAACGDAPFYALAHRICSKFQVIVRLPKAPGDWNDVVEGKIAA